MTSEDANGPFDAIIIGAGIVGTSIALALSRENLQTLNIDALPAAGYGTTSQSSAIIRPFYTHETAAAIAHEARYHWRTWQDFLESPEEPIARYTECGMAALLFESAETFEQNQHAMAAVGVSFETWDLETLERHIPGLARTSYAPPRRIDDPDFGQEGHGTLTGALFIPEAGYVNNPQGAAQDLMAAARRQGAAFQFNTKVTRILGDSSVEGVVTDKGEQILAPIVVNAAGPHSAQINDLAGIADSLPIKTRAMRHEVVYLKQPSELDRAPVTMDLDTGIYFRRDNADILIGTLDPPCDKEDFVDPDDFNEGFSDQWTNQAWRAGLRFPDLKISGQARGLVALYDVSDDWIPIYDKSDREGFFLAIGTSGNQFKNAPLIGRIMSQIISATRNGPDPDTKPPQLELPKIGRQVSLAHYGRNRQRQKTANVLA